MKTVLVTGASSGIGKAIAHTLAKEGHNVVLAARSEDELATQQADLEAQGYNALAVKTDVTDRQSFKDCVAKTNEKFGTVDVLVNNAGIMPLSFMKNLHEDEWEKTVDVNIKGVLNGIGAVLPGMLDQKGGHIINMSSVAGIKVMQSGAVYCGTKYAVEAITEGIRLELGDSHGIRTTVIRPGAVETNLMSTITDDEVKEKMGERFKDINFLEPQNIADAVAFAISQPSAVSVSEVLVRPTNQPM